VTINELDVGWATTENQQLCLHWELLACDEIRGVFETDREHTLAVLYDGDRFDFGTWARSLTTTQEQGAEL
jgi:hypothetical protein